MAEEKSGSVLQSPYGLPIVEMRDESEVDDSESLAARQRARELKGEARWWNESEITKRLKGRMQERIQSLRADADESEDRMSVRLHAKAQELEFWVRAIEELEVI